MEWLLTNAVALGALVLSLIAFGLSLRKEKRATEFSDVSWEYEWVAKSDGAVHVDLTHTGSTKAKRVRVKIETSYHGDIRGEFAVVKPGQTVSVPALPPWADGTAPKFARQLANTMRQDEPHRVIVNWLTPWGQPQEDMKTAAGRQLF